jgi:hypothetical protein
MNARVPLAAAGLAAAALLVTTACGAAPAATPAPAPAAAAATGPSVETACTNLLAVDGVPSPDSGPEGPAAPEEVKAFGESVTPLLDAALAAAPPDLAPSLTALQPFVAAAADEGVEPDFEDPAFTGALVGYETWAHENCGYQNIALAGTDFAFSGAPETLEAGPISMLLTNESTEGEFHVALLARANDPAMTVEGFQALSFEQLESAVELLPGAAAAPPGATGGVLAELEPGTYFILCPVGEEGEIPHHLQGMINRVTVA